MGVVYQARQVKLNRVVSLMMILAGGDAGAADLASFRTEPEVIARLQHPNNVQVFEVGEHGGLLHFSRYGYTVSTPAALPAASWGAGKRVKNATSHASPPKERRGSVDAGGKSAANDGRDR
jgi:hypothetical protein